MKTNNVFSATSNPPKKYTTVVSTVPVIKLKIDEVEQFVKNHNFSIKSALLLLYALKK